MMRCGLLGRKLGHSYSAQIHRELADYEYGLYEKEPEEIGNFLTNGSWKGLNITIPYKKEVMKYCSYLSDEAREAGAVNTLIRSDDGSIRGENTDVYGFLALLLRSGIGVRGKKVLVLGSGGASAAAVCALRSAGARTVVISRTGPDNYGNLERHADASVIVNATPVGMFPDNGRSPVSLVSFRSLEGVFDLIYNPARTAFMTEAQKLGIPAFGGLYMLVAQAKCSCELFTGKSIPDSETDRISSLVAAKMRNIVLIGMPGCGKSTVAGIIAGKTGRIMLDTDSKIEEDTGMSIPEYFERFGETAFRREEEKTVCELSKVSGAVISTGGGCVTTPANRDLLRQNGCVIWIKRDLRLLEREGRPLSEGSDLSVMYAARAPLYGRFADGSVCNDGTPEETAQAVIEETERYFGNFLA